MYRQAIVLPLGLCVCALAALPQTSSAPDQFVAIAVAHNRELLALNQRVAQARGLLKQANVGPPDNIEVSGLAGQPVGNRGEDSIAITYAHTFETFGKRNKRVTVAERQLALAQAEFDEHRRALALEVKQRFVDAASEQQKLETLDRLLAVNRDYLRLTEARVEKGDAARLEAELLRVELDRDQARRMLTAGRVLDSKLQLKALLDTPANEMLTFDASLTPPSFVDDLSRLQSLAGANRPDLIALRIEEQQSASQTALAKVETKPNITLAGQYFHADSSFSQYGLTAMGALTPIRDHDEMVGIGVSIPLTGARRNRGNIEASVARELELRLRRQYLESAIPIQVEAAYQRWRAARDAVAVFSGAVIGQSEKNLAVMRQAYQLGELRLLDILNEQRRLLDTELSYIDAQADLFRSYAELENAVGGSLL